jgi:hypothetical protein
MHFRPVLILPDVPILPNQAKLSCYGPTALLPANKTGGVVLPEATLDLRRYLTCPSLPLLPTIEETTLEPLPEEERPPYFIVAGKGNRQRWIFWDSVTAIDLDARENGDKNQSKRQ